MIVCSPVRVLPLITSLLLLCSVVSDHVLMACQKAHPQTPIPSRSLAVDAATKPLHPTSTGNAWARQPCCSASAAVLKYCSLPRCTQFHNENQYLRGWPQDQVRPEISCNYLRQKKASFWSRSTCIFQPRAPSRRVASTQADVGRALMVALLPLRAIASCLRTWLCLLV